MAFNHLFKRYKYVNTRQYLRLPAAWPIKSKALSPSTETGPLLSSTRDVSAGGISLTVRNKMPVGNRLTLEIHVPPLNRSISTEAEVVRCLLTRSGAFDLGLRFVTITPQDRADLDKAILEFYSEKERARQQKSWWRKLT